jgi:hypothetical protein
MTTVEERLKILQMLKDGKISVEEASELLKTLEKSEPARTSGEPSTPNTQRGRWMRIAVTDVETGKAKVNLKLPLGVVKAGLKLGTKFSPELEQMDSTKLMEAIQDGGIGKIIDVDDAEDHEHVEIFID